MLIFYWNDWNRGHIAVHGVTADEAKEVAHAAKRPYAMSLGNGKWLVRGSTSQGRHLQVIFVFHAVEDVDPNDLEPEDRLQIQEVEEVAYVIHARELTEQERRALRRMRRES